MDFSGLHLDIALRQAHAEVTFPGRAHKVHTLDDRFGQGLVISVLISGTTKRQLPASAGSGASAGSEIELLQDVRAPAITEGSVQTEAPVPTGALFAVFIQFLHLFSHALEIGSLRLHYSSVVRFFSGTSVFPRISGNFEGADLSETGEFRKDFGNFVRILETFGKYLISVFHKF